MTISDPVASANLFTESFLTLQDPRRKSKGNIQYSLEELLFVTITGVICGYQTWEEIAEYGELKIVWFRKFYTYKKMPSHDVLSRLFKVLDPKTFSECFINWVASIATKTATDVVAIDGKTIRGAASKGNKFPLHIVTAFCAKNRLTLGQQSVIEKSNELTAIPSLLDLLNLDGCTVTIDAIACQQNIAEKIIEKNADYILQVKNNQQYLKDVIEDFFNSKAERQVNQTLTQGHGRIEKRRCEVISDLEGCKEIENWKNLKSIVRIYSERTIKNTGEKSTEFRYYITSIKDDAKRLNEAIRSHWAIENNLHWNLDVIFKEDGQLKRSGNAAENFNIINKAALGLLDNEKSTKHFKPMKRMKAAHNDEYRELILKV
jgi:predicted transposase YbfD/YdcC